jgi:prophage antirepressor-like protein
MLDPEDLGILDANENDSQGLHYATGDNNTYVHDESGYQIFIKTPKGLQNAAAITESGMYHAIFNSQRPEAKIFRRWVTSDLLPTLRKQGEYTKADMEKAMTDMRSRVVELEANNEKMLERVRLLEREKTPMHWDTFLLALKSRDEQRTIRHTLERMGYEDEIEQFTKVMEAATVLPAYAAMIWRMVANIQQWHDGDEKAFHKELLRDASKKYNILVAHRTENTTKFFGPHGLIKCLCLGQRHRPHDA